jgi:hypothetical protein
MALAIESRALIRLSLTTELPAHAVADILRVADQIYIANVWLALLARAPEIGLRLSTFMPVENDTLLINHAEIGTPNFADLIGLSEPLLQTSGIIGAALGLGKVAVSVLQSWTDAKKTMAEIQRINAETAKLQLETRNLPAFPERAPEPSDPADKAQLDRLERMVSAVSETLLRRYVEGVSVIVVTPEPPPPMTLATDTRIVTAAELFGARLDREHVLHFNPRFKSEG